MSAPWWLREGYPIKLYWRVYTLSGLSDPRRFMNDVERHLSWNKTAIFFGPYDNQTCALMFGREHSWSSRRVAELDSAVQALSYGATVNFCFEIRRLCPYYDSADRRWKTTQPTLPLFEYMESALPPSAGPNVSSAPSPPELPVYEQNDDHQSIAPVATPVAADIAVEADVDHLPAESVADFPIFGASAAAFPRDAEGNDYVWVSETYPTPYEVLNAPPSPWLSYGATHSTDLAGLGQLPPMHSPDLFPVQPEYGLRMR